MEKQEQLSRKQGQAMANHKCEEGCEYPLQQPWGQRSHHGTNIQQSVGLVAAVVMWLFSTAKISMKHSGPALSLSTLSIYS